MKIASFEAFSTDQAFEILGPDIEEIPFSAKFEELGLGHHLVLNNLGPTSFVIMLFFPAYLVYLVANLF